MAACSRPLVLSILVGGNKYGYEILKEVKHLSDGDLRWSGGMLYPLLHRLERDGLVESYWVVAEEERRKYYRLTTLGRPSVVHRPGAAGRMSPRTCGDRITSGTRGRATEGRDQMRTDVGTFFFKIPPGVDMATITIEYPRSSDRAVLHLYHHPPNREAVIQVSGHLLEAEATAHGNRLPFRAREIHQVEDDNKARKVWERDGTCFRCGEKRPKGERLCRECGE